MKHLLFLYSVLFFIGCSSRPTPQAHKATLALEMESSPLETILISEPTENDGKPNAAAAFYVTEDIVKKTLPLLTSQQRLVYVGSAAHFTQLEKVVGKNSQLHHVEAPPYHWLQDNFKIFRDEQNKIVLGVPAFNYMLFAGPQKIAQDMDGRALVLPFQTPPVTVVDGDLPGPGFNLMGAHGTMGGNFERWTERIGFVGRSDFPTDNDALNFSKIIFPPSVKTVILPTEWLYLGHIDEVIKPIRFENLNHPQSCQITALVADPELGLQLIEENTSTHVFDSSVFKHKKIQDVNSLQFLNERFGLSSKANPQWSTLMKKKQRWEDLRRIQGWIGERQKALRADVEAAYANNCRIRWVPVPQLYLADLNEARTKVQRRSAGGLYANIVNGLIVGNGFATIDPMNALFRDHTSRQLKSLGVQTAWIPARGYFATGFRSSGHLHCMSQVIRKAP